MSGRRAGDGAGRAVAAGFWARLGRGAAAVRVVAGKEWRDALRDRRTLAAALLGSVALGPLLLALLSTLVAQLEARAELREVWMHQVEPAPTLVLFMKRSGFTVRPVDGDPVEAVRTQRIVDAVVVVPAGFEAALRAGEVPAVEVLSRGGNNRSQASAAQAQRLLAAFNQQEAQARLAWRGVAPGALQAVEVETRDLAHPAARAQQFTAMLPFFVVMAVLYGALAAALDTTAGERERGSLEPLLMNPVPALALVLGKWLAVAALALAVAALSVASFLPGQWLLRSDTLAALFRFGPGEAWRLLALLAPLAAATPAVLMAVAVRCRSVKEAQAHASLVMLGASLLPLVTWLQPGVEPRIYLAVPVLGQVTLMNRVLRGEPVGLADAAIAAAVAVAVTAIALSLVVGPLRRAVAGR